MTTVLQAIWPITDESLALHELIAQATPELPRIAAFAHAKIVGPPAWSIRPGRTVPGSGGARSVLFACVPARAVR